MNNFNLFQILQVASQRLLRIFTVPFYTIYRLIIRYASPNTIMSRVMADTRKGFQKLIKGKPSSIEDYVSLPNHYVAKKLLFVLILIALLLPVVYLYYLHPIVESKFLTKEMYVNATEMMGHTGNVRLLSNETGTVLYEGAMEEGRITGDGTLYDTDKNLVYQGTFLLEMYEGIGESYYPSGQVEYVGTFSKNKYEGQGILYTVGGSIKYEGEFQGGLYNGNGKIYYDNGTLMFEGTFENGKPTGNGTLYEASGAALYEGDLEHGNPAGTGTLYDEDGTIMYEGDLKNGKPEGLGTMYQDGKILYYGNFIDGKMNGEGQIYTDGRILYEGNFSNDNYSGSGKLYDLVTLELLYDGEFVAGKYSGAGRLYDSKGILKYDGEFYEGVYEGMGTLYDTDTEYPIYEGTFRDGRYDGSGKEYEIGTGLLVYEGEYLLGSFSGQGKLYDSTYGIMMYQGPFAENKPLDSGVVYQLSNPYVPIASGSDVGEEFMVPGELIQIPTQTETSTQAIVNRPTAAYAGPTNADGSINFTALAQLDAASANEAFGVLPTEWEFARGSAAVYEDVTENIGVTLQTGTDGELLGIDLWNGASVAGVSAGMDKDEVVATLGKPTYIFTEALGETRLVSISQSNRYFNRLTNLSADSTCQVYSYETTEGTVQTVFIDGLEEALILELR